MAGRKGELQKKWGSAPYSLGKSIIRKLKNPSGASWMSFGQKDFGIRGIKRKVDNGSLPPVLQHYLRWGVMPLLCPLGGEADPRQPGSTQGLPLPPCHGWRLWAASSSLFQQQPIQLLVTTSAVLTCHSESLTSGWRHT